MGIHEENSQKMYGQAYSLQYNAGRPGAAYALYNQIIELYPDSNDARSAQFQINEIKKVNPNIIPEQGENCCVCRHLVTDDEPAAARDASILL